VSVCAVTTTNDASEIEKEKRQKYSASGGKGSSRTRAALCATAGDTPQTRHGM
jgi:hypothetical protein